MSNPDDQIPNIEGERIKSIAAESSSNGSSNNTDKKLVAVGLIVFVGILGYMSFPSDEPEEVVEDYRPAPRVDAGSFQPADIPVELPPVVVPEVVEEEPEPEAPLGPIELIRAEKPEAPREPTREELIFESSIRAPVIAFSSGTGQDAVAQAAAVENGNNSNGLIIGNGPEEVNGIASQLKPTRLEGSIAGVLQYPELTITQGTAIPCILETAMDSTQPGMVVCRISDDIYGTTGTVVLLEKGSKVVGQYRGGLKRGEKRIFVIWSRVETPLGVIVNLDSPATDQLGRAGFTGDIDTQFWTRFSGTLMLSIVDNALATYVGNETTTTDSTRDLAATELESVIDVPVILRKNQGEEVGIMVARDLDFSSVYKLQAR